MSDYVLLQSIPCPPEHPNGLCCVSDDGVTWYGPKVFKQMVTINGGGHRFDVQNLGEKDCYFWEYARHVRMQVIYLDYVGGQARCGDVWEVNDDDSIILTDGKRIEAGHWKFLTPSLFKKEAMPNENTSK